MILVPLRGEKHFKPHPQNIILVPLRSEKHFKPHPQNRTLVPLSSYMGVPPVFARDIVFCLKIKEIVHIS